ncbi:MAG TPA: type I secretion C-terminal target domain-containing protein [Acidisphaera sp.]|nr:type I secretion C-terminal target domain-containing protein [Acidisphaera sp.]
MATIQLGPGLAGFPAYPSLAGLSTSYIAGLLLGPLGLQVTPTSLSFTLDSSLFGLPAGQFDYTFDFTGNFASIVPDTLSTIIAALTPATAGHYPVQFLSATVTDDTTGKLAVSAAANAEGPALPFAEFLSVLLNPSNFTQDVLGALTQNLSQFSTLDLSAFTGSVIDTRPNGPAVGTAGVIQKPDGSVEPAPYGLVSVEQEVSKLSFTSVVGGSGNDILGAGDGNTTVTGGSGNDLLLGGKGTDVLDGGSGNDILIAGSGHATLSGGTGTDYLVAGGGADSLNAGTGEVTLVAGSGADTLTGGSGADRFVIQRASGAVTTITNFNAGRDRLVLAGVSGQQRYGTDGHGDLTITLGTGGSAQTVILNGVASASQLGSSVQTAGPGDSQGAILLAPLTGGVLLANAQGETLIGQGGTDLLVGGSGNDTLVAGSGNDALVAWSGNNVLLGGPGNDTLIGGSGNDVLDGGDGNAVLVAGLGADVLTGGPGNDTFVFTHLSPTYSRITDFQPGQDKINLAALLVGANVTPGDLAQYVKVVPLGPTALTGFLEVSPTGTVNGFQVVAQIDGGAFQIGGSGQSQSQLTYNDFIFAPPH